MITKDQASKLRGLLARHAQTSRQVGYDMGRGRNYGRSMAEHNKSREAVYAYIRELEKGNEDGRTDQANTTGTRGSVRMGSAHAGPED